jgi:hypothetical protein
VSVSYVCGCTYKRHNVITSDCTEIGSEASLVFSVGCLASFVIMIVDQYSETNVMHFLLNLLRIKGLYMFRALLVHPQEVLHKRHLVYCVRMSVGCARIVGPILVQPPDITRMQYTKCRLCSAS